MPPNEMREAISKKVCENVYVYDRCINALDILRALGTCYAIDWTGMLFRVDGDYCGNVYTKDLFEIDLSQTLDEWGDDVISKIYELFYE